jgi:hypothetical protein
MARLMRSRRVSSRRAGALRGLAVEKAHLAEHFSGHDLADFHFAFGQLRHQAALPFEHEKQALADLADIGDDFAFFRAMRSQ